MRTKSGLLVRRGDLPAGERSGEHVEIVRPATGNLRVDLPYSDHDSEPTSIYVPMSYVSHFSLQGSGLNIEHATNDKVNELLKTESLEKKEQETVRTSFVSVN